MHIGIYPGSFDPVTFGHLDIIERSVKVVDKLIVGVLNNNTKTPLFSANERVTMLRKVTKHIPNIEIVSFSGLTIDFAKEMKANIIIRGLRAVTDFEYELQLAQTNHIMNPNIDTIFMTTNLEYAYLSSSVVKEVGFFKGNIDKFVSSEIVDEVYKKMDKIRETKG